MQAAPAAPVDPQRKGIALVVALAAILLASGLVLGMSMRVTSHATVAREDTLRSVAGSCADAAAWQILLGTSSTSIPAAGGTSTSEFRDRDCYTSVAVTRVSATRVWIVADASILRGAQRARQRVGVTGHIPSDGGSVALRPMRGAAWVESF